MTTQQTFDAYVQAAITGILANKNLDPRWIPVTAENAEDGPTAMQIVKDAQRVATECMRTREEAFKKACPPSNVTVKPV